MQLASKHKLWRLSLTRTTRCTAATDWHYFRHPRTKRTLTQLEAAACELNDYSDYASVKPLRRATKHKYPTAWDDLHVSELSKDWSVEAKLKGKVLAAVVNTRGWLLVSFNNDCKVTISNTLADKYIALYESCAAFKLTSSSRFRRTKYSYLVPKGWVLVDGKTVTLRQLYDYCCTYLWGKRYA